MGEVLSGGGGAPGLPADRLREELAALLARTPGVVAAGAAGLRRARLAARWLVEAELLGLRSFGAVMLLREFDRLDAQAGASARDPAPAQDSSAAVLALDASGIPGPLALAQAVEAAGDSARLHGIGLVGLRGVGALGVLGLAARELAGAGLVSLLAAQAPARVAPWGGTAAAIGTNPIAFGAPRDGAPPLVADFATSRITLAELVWRREAGEELPLGAALDADGAATVNPDRAATILPEGRLASLAGLLVELVAGVAVGGREPAGTVSGGRGAVVLTFDPARAGGSAVASDCARLAEDWRAAGGHLPGRFDALASADWSRPIQLSPDCTAWLGVRAGEARR